MAMADWRGRLWVGWLFDDDTWHRVCSGHTLAEASRALSDAADEAGVPDVWTCLTQGGVPVGPSWRLG
jgi:hypothetical protein